MDKISDDETTNDIDTIGSITRQWLEHVVIGCGFCPFASQPYLNNQVRIHIDLATNDEAVLLALHKELETIEQTAATKVETTLLVLPQYTPDDFFAFNNFLELAEALLEQQGWIGEFQIATFHPHYQFANTQANDAENLTNRAPYPILHIIREASLEAVIAHHSDPDSIYEKNIEKTKSFSHEQKIQLFPYLFNKINHNK